MLHNSVLPIIYKIIQYLNKKSSLASIKSFITDIAMGKITTADAVLLIHVLIKTVASIKPKTTFYGALLLMFTIFKAILLYKFTFSKAKATKE